MNFSRIYTKQSRAKGKHLWDCLQGVLNLSKILKMDQSKLLLQKTETFGYTPQLINLIEASNIHPNMYLMDYKP
jgi:hypothetical protein